MKPITTAVPITTIPTTATTIRSTAKQRTAALIIYKNDPDHVEKDENGKDVKKPIAGVQFELSYYDADPDTTKSLSDLGSRKAARTWVLKCVPRTL